MPIPTSSSILFSKSHRLRQEILTRREEIAIKFFKHEQEKKLSQSRRESKKWIEDVEEVRKLLDSIGKLCN